MNFKYDVIVIGGGHAGCEAACAAARMGAKTCLVTMDMNKIGQMSCNPAVGGIAKGQIVREIDALGGEMALVTDATSIQFRMLNRGKGPAVWSPRAQCDRGKFIWEWRTRLDRVDNLDIWQDEACELLVENGEAVGVETVWGVTFRAKAVIITAGTFLNGLMHVGRKKVPGGRCAEPAVLNFTESITRHGITSERMKTGTPVRIDRRSVHFEDMECQPGETDNHGFSYMTAPRHLEQLPCWTTYTNKEVHDTLREAIAESPLYNGQIQSTGPRYCPSIETKLMTFPDKDQHPLFLEPEGEDTNEMYLNGFSSSMPMEVQLNALKKIPAFRDIKVYRPGYAIEYDYFDPTQLKPSLESKLVKGLFFAGQVNGTTGYEEAGGQGTMAGINAALLCSGSDPYIMKRDEGYIGVLIDDLTTKGVDEPYRMFTSRAEYRILLRQDNADARLTEKAYNLGLATRERYDRWLKKKAEIDRIISFCNSTNVKPRDINAALESFGTTPLQFGSPIASLIARPQLGIKQLASAIPTLQAALDMNDDRKDEIVEAAEILIKYDGYIKRERQIADKMHRLEDIRIKGHFRYEELHEISTEGRQKLSRINPETLGQASRIPGVSPSDINVLLVLMKR
ncbi:tRNA uridine-5-carboxymethylaminomethyl(34) synthesis enzyme MnmG [Prevotella sp. 885]|uniref:tRNA uridine-5-carboxymethylaminomethyl(34) synthesis enzyme MnmG n=1 Tax=Prevotella sp. 885 TaxID=2022527 RepID=UPI000BA14E91|nr:tRNA uridine-5-carboxymethylaminomethyl(34) synthesis enzyme MnmG [Prevotella sp. 885]OZT02851.1 tRNA uridine-5-carboxymethylaminomethyl(34) synthesis enzyme MnmG [Prevotella sp. 885]